METIFYFIGILLIPATTSGLRCHHQKTKNGKDVLPDESIDCNIETHDGTVSHVLGCIMITRTRVTTTFIFGNDSVVPTTETFMTKGCWNTRKYGLPPKNNECKWFEGQREYVPSFVTGATASSTTEVPGFFRARVEGTYCFCESENCNGNLAIKGKTEANKIDFQKSIGEMAAEDCQVIDCDLKGIKKPDLSKCYGNAVKEIHCPRGCMSQIHWKKEKGYVKFRKGCWFLKNRNMQPYQCIPFKHGGLNRTHTIHCYCSKGKLTQGDDVADKEVFDNNVCNNKNEFDSFTLQMSKDQEEKWKKA